jgi:hypothetical protein
MSPVWTPGETVLTRFTRTDDSLGVVHPLRVLSDDGNQLLAWLPQDTPIIGSRLPDGRSIRDEPLANRFRAGRVQVRDTWHGTSTLRLIDEDYWSSVWWFFAEDGKFTGWYVNLEIPRGRTEDAVWRIDGALDVHIEPSRRWWWKDEDEADASVAAGRLTEDQLARLRAEGERMIGLAESGLFPFDGSWCDFRPGPDWPTPALPAEDWAALADPAKYT